MSSISLSSAVKKILESVGDQVVLAMPLGIGKPNFLVNALYAAIREDSGRKLTILTALSLNPPKGKSFLEKRFLGPFVERVFPNYPSLEYETDRVSGRLPENIEVIEFYFAAGKYLHLPKEQRNYLSSNYTHVVRDSVDRGVNLICQQVAKGEIDGEEVYSLSCNPDLTTDMVEALRAAGKRVFVAAQVNQELPFMYGESIVSKDFFDLVVDDPAYNFENFSIPKGEISIVDYKIALHASSLVKDDGELQIGIGSLGDALIAALCFRHEHNEKYRSMLKALGISGEKFSILKKHGEFEVFSKGLFAATEMFVDSYAVLFEKQILKKKVYDSVVIQRLLNERKISEEVSLKTLMVMVGEGVISEVLTQKNFEFLQEFGILRASLVWDDGRISLPGVRSFSPNLGDKETLVTLEQKALGKSLRNGAVAHAGFFVGCRDFYAFLKALPREQRKLIRMKKISQINQLYGHEPIDRLQRKNGRFINTCMKVTLNGSACSDLLENGNQVSGVGGQYNFVAMAHELPDARSILQLRSTYQDSRGVVHSNIVPSYEQCTIPRHLRDVVITEYGIANLRGKTNSEVAKELIQIADSRFQETLIAEAKRQGMISEEYRLPKTFAKNSLENQAEIVDDYQKQGFFQKYPFGSEFSVVELRLIEALKVLKSVGGRGGLGRIKMVLRALMPMAVKKEYGKAFQRMDLDTPQTRQERFWRRLLHYGLLRSEDSLRRPSET